MEQYPFSIDPGQVQRRTFSATSNLDVVRVGFKVLRLRREALLVTLCNLQGISLL